MSLITPASASEVADGAAPATPLSESSDVMEIIWFGYNLPHTTEHYCSGVLGCLLPFAGGVGHCPGKPEEDENGAIQPHNVLGVESTDICVNL
jgi:hypothetical protein